MPKAEPITVMREVPGAVDEFGQETIASRTAAATFNALVAPGPQVDTDGRNGWKVEYTLYSRKPVEILPTDQLTVRGETLRIVGLPQRWEQAYGPHQGIVIEVGSEVG